MRQAIEEAIERVLKEAKKQETLLEDLSKDSPACDEIIQELLLAIVPRKLEEQDGQKAKT